MGQYQLSATIESPGGQVRVDENIFAPDDEQATAEAMELLRQKIVEVPGGQCDGGNLIKFT